MRLDVDTLGTFYEMAREGAGLAADRLTAMTGVETRVGVTRLNFVRRETLADELDDGQRKVGVSVPFTGRFSGESLVVFDADTARDLARELVADVPTEGVEHIGDSALAEVSQIMSSGFVDGWAEVLDTVIDVETPTFVVDTDPAPFLERSAAAGDGDLVLLFQSRIEAVGTELAFRHFLFPEREAVEALLARSEGDGIEYEKLVGFNRMAQQGAAEVADNLTQLTGLDMSVSIQRINFLSLDTIPEEIPNERLISVAFKFDGTPSGYLVFVYDEESARGMVEATLPGGVDDGPGIGEMGRDAIGEFSNIMASGFLDGWANVLDTTIEHTTPRYTHDLGAAVIDPLVIGLSRDQEFAFVFDTNVESVERSFDVDVYAIPDEEDLERALSALDLRKVGKTPTEAEFEAETTDHDAIDSIRDLEVE